MYMIVLPRSAVMRAPFIKLIVIRLNACSVAVIIIVAGKDKDIEKYWEKLMSL